MGSVFVQMCSSMYQIPTRVFCMLLVLLQSIILDYYLVHHKNVYWYSWIAADVAQLFVFFVAFMISYRHLSLAKHAAAENTPIQTGALPLGYFAWLLYSSLLAARVAIIYKDFAWKLDEKDFFGPNTLKITISGAAFIFLLLLLSHHSATPDSERNIFISELTGTVVFDVLDSVDILDVLFDREDIEDFPVHLDTTIISIACVNLILPTLPLMTLSRAHFGHKRTPKEITTLHKLLVVFLVNVPLLIVRLLLWGVLSKEISIFPVKNVIVIFLVCHDLYENQREEIERVETELDGGPDLPSDARHHNAELLGLTGLGDK